MRRRTLVVATIVLALGAGATGTAIAIGDDSDGSKNVGSIAVPSPAEKFAEQLSQQFSAASGPSATVDPDDVAVTSRIQGANPSGARLARRAPDGTAVYVMPSNDGFCVASASGVESNCYETPALRASSVICAPGLPQGQIEIYGVAPDGNEKVTVNLDGGSSRAVAVEGNVFIYRASVDDPRPLTVSTEDQSGKVTTADAHVPEDFREGCAPPAGAP